MLSGIHLTENVHFEKTATAYPECEDGYKSLTFCASLHIHDVLIKGVQHKYMVKFVCKRRWLPLLVNSQHCKVLILISPLKKPNNFTYVRKRLTIEVFKMFVSTSY